MNDAAKAPSRLAKDLLELAADMKTAGMIDEASHRKITLRHIDLDVSAIAPLSPDDVKRMREKARMSQAVFARHLNLTVGYVSQLERGTKSPAGAALALLDVVRRKGIGSIL